MKSVEQLFQRIGWLFAILLVTIVLLGSVCMLMTAGNEESRLTIAVKQGVEGVALKETAKRFSQAKHISVEVVEFPYDKLYEEEERQLRNKPERKLHQIPPFDVIMVDDPWLYPLIYDPRGKSLRLQDVSGILKGKGNDFFETTLDVARYCDPVNACSFFGVPFVANSQLFAHEASDSSVVPDPPTWEGIRNAAEKRQINYPARIGPGNSIVTDFMPILWAYDPNSFLEYPAGSLPFDKPDGSFETLRSLVGTRKNLGSASFDDFDVSAYLLRRKDSVGIVWSAWAMMLVGTETTAQSLRTRIDLRPNFSDSFQAKAILPEPPSSKSLTKYHENNRSSGIERKLIFGHVPSLNASESKPELGVWLLGIPRDSEQSVLALEFVKFATDLGDDQDSKRGVQSLAAALAGTPPPRKSVLAQLSNGSKYAREPSLIPAISWSLEHARARPRTPCWREIEKALGTYLEAVIDGRMTSHQIADRTNEELTPLFTKEGCDQFLLSEESK